jgi:hypothetical protein
MAIWSWLKNNWKYLLGPLWLLTSLLTWVFSRKIVLPAPLVEKEQILGEFRKKLDDLAVRAEQRLLQASKDQLEEFKTLKDKPVSEIAAWIDRIS